MHNNIVYNQLIQLLILWVSDPLLFRWGVWTRTVTVSASNSLAARRAQVSAGRVTSQDALLQAQATANMTLLLGQIPPGKSSPVPSQVKHNSFTSQAWMLAAPGASLSQTS